MTLKRACMVALSLSLGFAPMVRAEDDNAVASYKRMVAAASKYKEGQEEKGTFQERMNGQSKAWNEYKAARAEHESAMNKAKKAREAAQAQVEKDQGKVLSLESQLNNDTDAYTRFVKEQQGKGKDVTGKGFLGLGIGTSAEQDRAEALRTAMRTAEEKLVETRNKIAEGEARAKAQKKAQEDNQKKMEDAAKQVDAYAKGYNVVKDEKEKAILAAAGKAAQELFLDMQKDVYEADLLLTSYDALKTKSKLNEIQLNALQAQANQHLQNTIFGKFVQARIEEALKKENICKAVNQCEPPAVYDAKKVSDLERRVNDLAAKSGEEAKTEEAAEGGSSGGSGKKK